MKARAILVAAFIFSLLGVSYAGKGIPDSLKMCIYKTKAGPEVGTSICFRDEILGVFFLTCKHVITDSCGALYDTATFYRNEFLPNGTIYSGTNHFSVALDTAKGGNVLLYPEVVDLALISPEKDKTISTPEGLYFQYFNSSILLAACRRTLS